MTRQDQLVAVPAMVEDRAWLGKLRDDLRGRLAPVFARAGSRWTAFAYVDALLAEPGDRRSCWQLAERACQHAGITGQVENCQTVVMAAYVAARGHAPYDFRL